MKMENKLGKIKDNDKEASIEDYKEMYDIFRESKRIYNKQIDWVLDNLRDRINPFYIKYKIQSEFDNWFKKKMGENEKNETNNVCNKK